MVSPPNLRAAYLCLALAGCSSTPTTHSLRVDLRTDFVAGAEFDAVAVYIGEGDIREEFSHVVNPGRDYLRGVALGDLATGPGEHVAEVVLFQDGVRVISRTVSVLVEASITVATVVITRDCRGVMCPGDGNPLLASCLGGRCADPRCTLETPEFCPEGGCFVDGDCPPLGCGAPLCVSNVCLYSPDDGACDAGFACDLDRGCVVSDAPDGSTPDGSTPDGSTPDGSTPDGSTPDGSMPDGSMPDGETDAPADAGTDVPFDAGPPPGCPDPDPSTVFLFDFEGTGDRASAFSGEVRDGAALAPGDSPCGGDSLQVTGPGGRWFIADRPEFQLAQGSVDFWVLPAAASGATVGLVSRDESGQDTSGHFSVFYTMDERLTVRAQTLSTEQRRCGPSLSSGSWHRVGINFGPDRFELYVDGVLQMGTGTSQIFTTSGACLAGVGNHSLVGNNNPFVVGSSAYSSDPGLDTPPAFTSIGWQYDHVRLSDTYRDYAAEL